MKQGTSVFSQIFSLIDYEAFRRCVRKYDGDKGVRRLSCWEQFLALAFAQLTHREGLRDIEVSLNANRRHLYHSGFRSLVKKSTLADANESRDWRIFAEFGQDLIKQAQTLYAGSDLGLQLDGVLYALDSTTIDLSLTLFPWAPYEQSKAAVKVHTLFDVNGSIPVFINITDIRGHDAYALDHLVAEPGCFIVMDRGYIDFPRLFHLHQSMVYFVVRAKKNLRFRRRCSHPIDRSTGVRSDQTIVLNGQFSFNKFPSPLRRVSFYAADIDKRFVFLTNNFHVASTTVAAIYKQRWQVELFFKWIKQHLRIKRFFGTSPNAVKIQIWTAVSTYVLIAIIRKKLGLDHSLHTILQILSTTLFEKTPVPLVFQRYSDEISNSVTSNQLTLFEI